MLLRRLNLFGVMHLKLRRQLSPVVCYLEIAVAKVLRLHRCGECLRLGCQFAESFQSVRRGKVKQVPSHSAPRICNVCSFTLAYVAIVIQ